MSGLCGVWTRAKCTFCLSLTLQTIVALFTAWLCATPKASCRNKRIAHTLLQLLASAAASICFVNNSLLYPKCGIIYSGLLSFCSDQGQKEKMHCSSDSLRGSEWGRSGQQFFVSTSWGCRVTMTEQPRQSLCLGKCWQALSFPGKSCFPGISFWVLSTVLYKGVWHLAQGILTNCHALRGYSACVIGNLGFRWAEQRVLQLISFSSHLESGQKDPCFLMGLSICNPHSKAFNRTQPYRSPDVQTPCLGIQSPLSSPRPGLGSQQSNLIHTSISQEGTASRFLNLSSTMAVYHPPPTLNSVFWTVPGIFSSWPCAQTLEPRFPGGSQNLLPALAFLMEGAPSLGAGSDPLSVQHSVSSCSRTPGLVKPRVGMLPSYSQAETPSDTALEIPLISAPGQLWPQTQLSCRDSSWLLKCLWKFINFSLPLLICFFTFHWGRPGTHYHPRFRRSGIWFSKTVS